MASISEEDSSSVTYIHYDEEQYDNLLFAKVHSFLRSLHIVHREQKHALLFSFSKLQQLNDFIEDSSNTTNHHFVFDKYDIIGPCDVIRSPKRHCRQRVRFQVVQETQSDGTIKFNYAMWDHGGPNAIIKEFPMAAKVIFDLMPEVLVEIENPRNGTLSKGLQAISYLSSTIGEVVITLIYDRDILLKDESEDDWEQVVICAKDRLFHNQRQKLDNKLEKLSIIGRSKGRKVIVGTNYVQEHLHLDRYDGRTLFYKQVDDGFSNPNGVVNMKALDWLCHVVKDCILPIVPQQPTMGPDLLEMYCGNGNHTVALAAYFRAIMAVEINDKLCNAAKENFLLNNVSNVRIKACNSSKFAAQILKYKKFSYQPSALSNGLDTPVDFHFGTVLVDPPRAGLDPVTLRAVVNYDNIIYISCNPEKLLENLVEIGKTHEISKIAAFDHFAYTNHLEVGVLLQRRISR